MQVITFFLGLGGFMVALRIYKHKKTGIPLVCMAGFDCHTVVHSDYSKFLGIRVELLGMLYYTLIFSSYLLFMLLPSIISNLFIGFLVITSLIGFLFSVYLIAVQIFILKKGCSWCIVSAFICALIFSLTLYSYDLSEVAEQIFLSRDFIKKISISLLSLI